MPLRVERSMREGHAHLHLVATRVYDTHAYSRTHTHTHTHTHRANTTRNMITPHVVNVASKISKGLGDHVSKPKTLNPKP
jgi:hypothetical protein